MDSSFVYNKPSEVILKFSVKTEEVEHIIRKAYRDISFKGNVPGFRRGHIPSTVINRMYGRDNVIQSASQDIFEECSRKAIEEHQLGLISVLDIEDFNFKDNLLNYKTKLEVWPKIDINYGESDIYLDDYIDTDTLNVDNLVEETLKREANFLVELHTVDRGAIKGDILSLLVKYGDQEYNITYEIGKNIFIDNFDDVIIGKKHNNVVELESILSDKCEYSEFDSIEKGNKFIITIKDISEKKFPEIDDKLASSISEYDTINEYRESIKKNILKDKKEQQSIIIRDYILNYLLDNNVDVALPDGVLKEKKEAITSVVQLTINSDKVISDSIINYMKPQFFHTKLNNDHIRQIFLEAKEKDKLEEHIEEFARNSATIAVLFYNIIRENSDYNDIDYRDKLTQQAKILSLGIDIFTSKKHNELNAIMTYLHFEHIVDCLIKRYKFYTKDKVEIKLDEIIESLEVFYAKSKKEVGLF